MSRKKYKSYKLIGAYDSETTNIVRGVTRYAFPILHQLGIIDMPIEQVTNDNVEQVTNIQLYRHTIELYKALDDLADTPHPFVPVIACHNLAFDMYGLAPWLMSRDVRVLAKSLRKPLIFTILKDNEPSLVIWDTLTFTQKSLDYMGKACGYHKLVGAWDYDKIRTPDTPLTDEELAYATHDIYALLAYMGYWCRLNPDIDPSMLGRNVITKTGVVRARRMSRFGAVKGKKLPKSVGQYWIMQNHVNAFKTDDELFTGIASTRGGLTFVASKNASVPFDCAGTKCIIAGYDATSQHPSQIVTHKYPTDFKLATPDNLQRAFNIVTKKSVDDVLKRYYKPFVVAFYGVFEISDLKPKKGSVFERFGIYPFASARCKEYEIDETLLEENQDFEEFRKFISDSGYRDIVTNGRYEFGKLVSADKVVLFLTELAAWELSQAYDYSSVKAISGYMTMQFSRPSDMATLSVMNFYAAKNEFKKAMKKFHVKQKLDNAKQLIDLGIPEFVVQGMNDGTIDESTVENTYLGLKADLNALFGIEATNEYRRDTILDESGISYTGDYGICNAPKTHKAFYQFGQRIVGWSRIAQILVMQLVAPHVETIINGDTDSIKVLVERSKLADVDNSLARLSCAIDDSKKHMLKRARLNYPALYNPLNEIGYYVKEFEVMQFAASWNKAYMLVEDGDVKFTIAGIPAKRGSNQLATKMYNEGASFGELSDVFLGYNVTYSHSLINLFARKFPEWGSMCIEHVTDYLGNETLVVEPSVMCLYPMAKTINDTSNRENAANMEIAQRNRESVNTDYLIIGKNGFYNV